MKLPIEAWRPGLLARAGREPVMTGQTGQWVRRTLRRGLSGVWRSGLATR